MKLVGHNCRSSSGGDVAKDTEAVSTEELS